MQEIEGFDAGNELTLQQGLTEGCVQYEIISIQFCAAITSATIHVGIR